MLYARDRIVLILTIKDSDSFTKEEMMSYQRQVMKESVTKLTGEWSVDGGNRVQVTAKGWRG